MSRRRLRLLAILALCVGTLVAMETSVAGESAALPGPTSQAAPPTAAPQPARKPMPFPAGDPAMEQGLPRNLPRPASEWLANEKAFYQKLLARGRFDVLVVPFQVVGHAFDRGTRSLMSAQLAAALQAANATVPDPYLVAKALGDGQRELKQEEIYRLANAIGAKRIVWGHAGYNAGGRFVLSLQSQERSRAAPASPAWTGTVTRKEFGPLLFAEETTPLGVYEELMPQILSALGVERATSASPAATSTLELASLPTSPMGLLSGPDRPAQDAYTFLLFAGLTPDYQERTRRRFAEKALLAISRMAPQSPEYRALRARALLGMGYRPAAIKALGTPQTNEERALLALLQGNLPALRDLASAERHPLKRLLLKLDANGVGSDYGSLEAEQSLAEVQALALPGESWPVLAARAFSDWEIWSQHENLAIKQLLDRELPVPGYSLEQMLRGAASLGDMARIRSIADLSVFSHGRKLIESRAEEWCCRFAAGWPQALDYLDLLQAIGHDNLIRRLKFLSEVQGNPRQAVEFANGIDALYRGYPHYALERSKAEARLAASAEGAERESLQKMAYANAFNALYWEQAQSLVSAEAFEQIGYTGRNDYGPFGNLYFLDIPYHPLYATWALGGDPFAMARNGESSLRNATSQFRSVPALAELYRNNLRDEARLTKLLQSIEGRFAGNPLRGDLLADLALQRGDEEAAVALHRENIKASPLYWKSYFSAGSILIESGEVRQAAALFLAFPGFKPASGIHRVGVSNAAYEAGSLLYWSGHFSLARPLYEIAAAQGSGSGAEIASASRLRLLEGDIGSAMAGALERGQRYNDLYAYRDYLGMLHATGHSREAWAGFESLARALPEPQVWETALVGHHIAGATEQQVIEWAKSFAPGLESGSRSRAAAYLLRFATTDRTPSKALSAVIDAIDGPVWKLDDKQGSVVRPSADQSTGLILGPLAGSRDAVLPYGVLPSSRKQRVKSDLAYFSDGYRAIKLGEFAVAKSVFDEAASFYDLAGRRTIYMLPYFALAAARAGDALAVENVLRRVEARERKFDYHLARAILAGLAGRMNDALRSLELARHRRPHTEDRPLLTQYTYGEICELLWHATRDKRIRYLALEWAKAGQRFEPWQSWGYAIEARLATKSEERDRAIGMAHYLDPNSERTSAFTKSAIEAAAKGHRQSNPFLRIDGSRKPGAT